MCIVQPARRAKTERDYVVLFLSCGAAYLVLTYTVYKCAFYLFPLHLPTPLAATFRHTALDYLVDVASYKRQHR